MKTPRRSLLKKLVLSVVGISGIGSVARASSQSDSRNEKHAGNIVYDQEVPLFSGHTKFGGLVYIAGKGAHFEGDIKAHTDHVLKELEKELIAAGSSMEKVLKVTVF